jgi:hypothetical protein
MNLHIIMPVLRGISKGQESSMLSRDTRNTAVTEIGLNPIKRVIGRNGTDRNTGEQVVMRTAITAVAVDMATDIIHFIQ